jgi:prefoldin subunit 4
MTSAKQEDMEVRFEDQEKINEFGRLNNRLVELKADIKQLKLDIEKLDDSNAELMMCTGGKVMLLMGETFIETDEDYATEYTEKKQKELQERCDAYSEEAGTIESRQAELKKALYGRFGDSINLENSG